MELDHYILLIYKELKGEITSGERETLLAYKKLNQENKQVYSEIEKSWEGTLVSNLDIESDLLQLNDRINDKEPKIVSIVPKFFRIAAMLIVTVAATLLIYQRMSQNEQIYYAAEDMQVTLAEGTMVSLKQGSTLSHNRRFRKDRQVTLVGTAFFEVAKDTLRRFLVLSSAASVEVLGTSFTVNETKGNVVTSVLEGRVKLSSDGGEVILTANEVGIVDENRGVSKIPMGFKNFDYWISGQFRFENEPLSEIFAQLSLIFDLDIEIANQDLLSCTVSGVFNSRDGSSLIKKIADKFEIEVQEESPGRFTLLNGQCN